MAKAKKGTNTKKTIKTRKPPILPKTKRVQAKAGEGADYNRSSGFMEKTVFNRSELTKRQNKAKSSRTVKPNTLGAKQQARYSKYLKTGK